MEYMNLKDCAKYSKLRTSNITEATYISTENMVPNKGGITTISSVPECKSIAKYEPGDILLSNIRPYFCKIWYATREGGCSNDVLVIKANKNIDSKFLYYVLSDKNFFNYDTVTSKGTKMPRGNKNAIMKYLVPKVSLSIQQKVASILSTYDSLIENNTKRICMLEQMAEKLYKEWFVRFRFPGYENIEVVNGLPKGWKIERLENLLDIKYGKDHKKIEDGDIPILGSGGIMRYGNKALYSGESVLIPRKGTLNNIMFRDDSFWTVDTMFYTIPKKKNVCRYMYYVLSGINLESFNPGAALPSMTTNILNRMRIILPNNEILEEFNKKVTSMYEEVKNLKGQSKLLCRQRDLLLPRLMSGKLEVKG